MTIVVHKQNHTKERVTYTQYELLMGQSVMANRREVFPSLLQVAQLTSSARRIGMIAMDASYVACPGLYQLGTSDSSSCVSDHQSVGLNPVL